MSWFVQETTDKGDAKCRAFLKCDSPCLLSNAPERTWKVSDGTTFQLQADVVVSITTPQTYDENLDAVERRLVDEYKVIN